MDPDFLGSGYQQGLFYQVFVISFTHIGETRTDAFIIWTDQGIRKKADVVSNNHYVANSVIRINSSCCIAQKETLDTEKFQYSYRESYLFSAITFIEMKPSLH